MPDHLLPCWIDGTARSAILAFVACVTAERGPDFSSVSR
jgi:hypothetical protein